MWIDIRIRKPTESDGDECGGVLVLTIDMCCWHWLVKEVIDSPDVVAWMPVPKFDPVPEPPDGYRLVDTTNEPFDKRAKWYCVSFDGWLVTNSDRYKTRYAYCVPIEPPAPEPPDGYRLVDKATEPFNTKAMYWDAEKNQWQLTGNSYVYIPELTYCVPIEPPAPKYRPFANAAEFNPFREKWWRYKEQPRTYPPASYSDTHYGGRTYAEAFNDYEFEEGTPFGMRVEE